MSQRRRTTGASSTGVGTANVPSSQFQPSNQLSKNWERRLLLVLPLVAAAIIGVRYRELPSSRLPGLTEEPVPPANESRIAVCYAGHVGTLGSVYRQNERAIGALSSVPPAYFFTVDLKDDYLDPVRKQQVLRTHDIGSLQPIFDALKARAVQTVSLSKYTSAPEPAACTAGALKHLHRSEDEVQGQNAREHRPVVAENYGNAYAQFMAFSQCYKLIRDDELETGQRFHYILALRPDMHLKLEMPLPTAKPRIHLSGAALALIPRSMADIYFSIVRAFKHGHCRDFERASDKPCKGYSYERDTAECLIIKWLRRRNIKPSNGVLVNRRIIYPEVNEAEE